MASAIEAASVAGAAGFLSWQPAEINNAPLRHRKDIQRFIDLISGFQKKFGSQSASQLASAIFGERRHHGDA